MLAHKSANWGFSLMQHCEIATPSSLPPDIQHVQECATSKLCAYVCIHKLCTCDTKKGAGGYVVTHYLIDNWRI